jgi:hypothetical protein
VCRVVPGKPNVCRPGDLGVDGGGGGGSDPNCDIL